MNIVKHEIIEDLKLERAILIAEWGRLAEIETVVHFVERGNDKTAPRVLEGKIAAVRSSIQEEVWYLYGGLIDDRQEEIEKVLEELGVPITPEE